MNKTDKRQFLDEIEMLGKSKQHSTTFIKAFKGSITFETAENVLYEKRKAYNFAYTNLYRKYNVKHEDLYGELDKIWNIGLNEKDEKKQGELVASLAAAAGTAGFTSAATAFSRVLAVSLSSVLGPLAIGSGLWHIIRMQYKVKRLWKLYKNNCQIYAENYINSMKTER